MFLVNEKSTATGDVILKALKNTLVTKKKVHEGLDFFLLFPDQTGVMNLCATTEGLKNAEKTKKIVQPFQFFLFPVK